MDIFLKYGIDGDNQLIYIDQAPRGRTALRCPYCGVALVARKGQIKVAHFAHDGPTCAAAGRAPDEICLPAYDSFNLRLPGHVIAALRRFADGQDYSRHDLDMLIFHELISENEWNRTTGFDLTHKGKLPLGRLSLDLFNKFQEPLITARHDQLDRAALHAYQYRDVPARIRDLQAALNALNHRSISDQQEHSRIVQELARLRPNNPQLDLATALIDLRLYRNQWQRILASTLYFLKIGTEGLYKIGVTTRGVEERLHEIEAELMLPLGQVKIEVIDTWPSRGNVERYFLHRYAAHHQPIGNLTEYFRFVDAKPVIRDLRRMQDKTLSALENQVLAGLSASAETEIAQLQVEAERRAEQTHLEAERQAQLARRSEHIRAGMRRVAALGQGIGRPEGSRETDAQFMQKPTSRAIRAALDEGLSIRQTAARVGVSINTVQKVKALLTK